ncbi:protein phosphatase, putative [Plasmodium knowlesi strain H]|uniref:Protein phosphatase, putative n=1 Tax=Plasmodium knowlesi (strain H) TaxID=5851 RepID=A0A1A7VEK6_PLAKH|nr:protein phosphatase, putative [Plasmodium knowlesi strain H]
MWNQLQEGDNEYPTNNRGIASGFKKYKSFIYILLIILVVFGVFISYYELNDKQVDFELDCNDLNEKCLKYKYPEFKPKRLIIVDVNSENNNVILRSSAPLFNGRNALLLYLPSSISFVLSQKEELLRKHIKEVMEEGKLKYSDDMALYIISFLRNDPKEGCCYTSERCYVKDANIVNQIIRGHQEDPYEVDAKTLDNELKSLNWDTDQLLSRINELNEKFQTMKNTIFIIHCRRGRDRTGEYVGAYKMIVKKQNFDSVMKENEEIGKVKSPYVKMEKWLCLYLEKVMGYTDIGCYDFR